jgi:hypothetical protein
MPGQIPPICQENWFAGTLYGPPAMRGMPVNPAMRGMPANPAMRTNPAMPAIKSQTIL